MGHFSRQVKGQPLENFNGVLCRFLKFKTKFPMEDFGLVNFKN